MAEFLSSKISLVEEEPSIRSFPTIPTAVLAAQGISERGPFTPTLVTSFDEYTKKFGGFISGRELAQAVRAFFLEGGREAWISRVAHYTDVSDPGTLTAVKGTITLQTAATSPGPAQVTGTNAAPWSLSPGDTLVISDGGTGPDTATFDAAAAARECTTAENYNFSGGGETLTVKIDQEAVAQTITFQTSMFVAPAAATADEVTNAINGQLLRAAATTTSAGTRVTITSDKQGTGSYVEVTGGTANAILNFNVAEVQGTGDVADITAVTLAEAEIVIEADVISGNGVVVTDDGSGRIVITTVDTGAGASVQVQAASTAETIFGLDTAVHNGSSGAAVDTLKIDGLTEGSYTDNLTIKVEAATSGEASEFNMVISSSGIVQETYVNLTMDTTETRHVDAVVNAEDGGSNLIATTDQSAVGTPTQRRPANVSAATPAGGDDGLTSLDANDFIGNQGALTGVFAYDQVEDVTILISPDETDNTLQNAMISYCETTREKLIFAILDPAAGSTTTAILAQRAALQPLNTESAAMYWPRVKIANPQKSIFGTGRSIVVPPSGHVAGIMARNDVNFAEGPFYQPAGVEGGVPLTVVGLESDEVKLEAKRNLVFPKRINPITSLTGFGVFIDGARTLKEDGNFPSIGERRGISSLEKRMRQGLQWVRHRNNTPELRRRVERQIELLLYGEMVKGSFASEDPSTAFFVDVSDQLNPPSAQRQGKLFIRIGIATAKPAEFIVLQVTQDTRALEEELLSAGL
jgi:phage tail sheath protein FI